MNSSSLSLFLAFPGFKRKALTFSYDDSPPGDTRLVETLNRHSLKGSFNINTFGRKEWLPQATSSDEDRRLFCNLSPSERSPLYDGHEIALHGARHETFGSVAWPTTLEDIRFNKETLEAITGKPVTGFAFPCGALSDTPESQNILRTFGITYARLVHPSSNIFALPEDFLSWHPTAHHNANIDSVGRDFLAQTPTSYEPIVCYIWGHSFEFDCEKNWDILDHFCELMANRKEIWYATNIEIAEYIIAARKLSFTLRKDAVYNPTATPICLFVNNSPHTIPPGATIHF